MVIINVVRGEDVIFRLGQKCTCCGIEKPVEDFPKNRNRLSGRRGNCKECYNKKRRGSRTVN